MATQQQLAKPAVPKMSRHNSRVSRGIVGFWGLHEGSGSVASDISETRSTGTLSGTTPPSWSGGPRGWCLNNTVNTGYVTIPDKPQYTFSAGTMAAFVWVNGADNAGTIFGQYDTGANKRSWQIRDPTTGGAGTFQVIVTSDGIGTGTSKNYTSSLVAFDGTWHHIGFRIDIVNNFLQLFVDSVLDPNPTKTNDPTLSAIFDSDQPIGLFTNFSSGTPATSWVGTMDAPMLWNRSLAVSDICEVYRDAYAICRHRHVFKSAAVPSSVLFRKSASRIGTRTGTRQTWAV